MLRKNSLMLLQILEPLLKQPCPGNSKSGVKAVGSGLKCDEMVYNRYFIFRKIDQLKCNRLFKK